MKKSTKRRLRRGLLILLAAWLALVLLGWAFAWRRLPYYSPAPGIELPAPVLTEAEYAAVIDTHARPFIVSFDDGEAAVVLYGATHTKDPADPQVADIERRWTELRPTVALCESRLGILFPGLMDPIREFAEPGLVHQLARRDGAPTYTWEATTQTLMEHLLDLPFSREQIALRLKLGTYFSNLRFGRPADPEARVLDTLGDAWRWPGLEDTLSTIEEIDAAWLRHFPDGPNWRDVSDEYGLPGFLAEISTNPPRDEHFARVIVDLVGRGERVFAVAGLSHAVKLEPVLRALFEEDGRE